MAIIPELPGLSVEIVLKNNEEALVEYHNEDDVEPNNARYTTQNFIEAKTGAAFGIRCRRASNETLDEVLGTYSVAMLIYVGDDCLDDIVEDPSDPIGVTSWGSPSGPAGNIIERDYIFSALDIVEDHDLRPDAELATRLAKAGTITIHICRAVRLGDEVERTTKRAEDPFVSKSISEKALKGKAISHSVGLGEDHECSSHWVKMDRIDDERSPLATFVFKYRSMAALRALGLVAREDSTHLEDRHIDTLTIEEARELLRRQRSGSTQAGERKRKLEIKAEILDNDDEVVVVQSTSKRQRSGGTEIEIVDLTG